MLGSVATFALANVAVKAVPRIPAHEIVFFRALVTLVLGWLLIRRQGLSPWGVNKPMLLARGAAGTLALLLYFHTLQHLPLGTAVTLQNTSPIFTILIAALWLGERPRWVQIPFLALAFVGVAVIKGAGGGVSLSMLVIALAAAVFSGVAYNLVRRLRTSDHALVVVFYFPFVSMLVVGPWTVLSWVRPSAIELGALLGIGLATTVAQILLTVAYQRGSAANVSASTYLGVVLALGFGALFWGEIPTAMQGLGVVVTVGGVALCTWLGPRG